MIDLTDYLVLILREIIPGAMVIKLSMQRASILLNGLSDRFGGKMKGLKAILKEIKILKKIYIKLLNVREKVKNCIEGIIFTVRSKNAVNVVQKVFEKSGHPFFFDMGTLLGMVRDGKLLKRDMDIDTGIYIKNTDEINEFRKLLNREGFKHKFIFSAEGIGEVLDTFYIEGVRVDICYYKREADRDCCYLFYGEDGEEKTVRLFNSKIEKMDRMNFLGLSVNVPENKEKYLEERYGNWRVPDKKYKYWEGPSTEKIDNKPHTVQLY